MTGTSQKDAHSSDHRDCPTLVTNPSSVPVPISSTTATPATPVTPSADVPPSATSRFVMNRVEKTWIIAQLLAFGAPLQKMKTLDATCARVRVAESARSRHIPDTVILEEQNQHGMSWRRAYMARISGENVRHIANSINDMAKKVIIASVTSEDEGELGPVAAARGKDGDAQHILDQVVLDYKEEASKRALTTDDDAAKAISRARESRAQKKKRNEERRAVFEANKKRRGEARNMREKRRLAAEVQYLRAQTRIANAASASASLQRRQSEQFGILTDLFARNHSLSTQQPATPLPAPLPEVPLAMDPVLLVCSQGGTEYGEPAFDTAGDAES